MAKIVITIEGDDVTLTVDGTPVENLKDTSFYSYQWNDGCKDVSFRYSVRNPEEGAFSSTSEFVYNPSKASFTIQENPVNIKEPTSQDYAKL